MNKYELAEKQDNGLYRIRALKGFGDVKKGDLGGFVSGVHNLSQEGLCWVQGDALVSGDAWVFGNARVSDDARVSDNARVSANARVSDYAQVFGNAWVYGDARVFGDALVFDDALVFGNARVSGIMRSDGYSFIAVPDKNNVIRVIAGRRYFTFDEAYEHWELTRKDTPLGDETIEILNFMKKMVDIKGYAG